MDPQKMMAGLTRETEIRRDARGRWWNGGDLIDHPSVARAFDGWLDVAEDGRFCLRNDINWAYVEVEGPPFRVRQVRTDEGAPWLSLSGGLEERLDPRSLRQDAEGHLYCDVRGGRLAACFDRYALADLVEQLGGEDAAGPYLKVGGEVYRPAVVDDPLRAGTLPTAADSSTTASGS